jgi:hypothetical protein
MQSWPEFISAIIGQSGGHCIEPTFSGTHIASVRNGSMTTAVRTPVETNLCQKRMIYVLRPIQGCGCDLSHSHIYCTFRFLRLRGATALLYTVAWLSAIAAVCTCRYCFLFAGQATIEVCFKVHDQHLSLVLTHGCPLHYSVFVSSFKTTRQAACAVLRAAGRRRTIALISPRF